MYSTQPSTSTMRLLAITLLLSLSAPAPADKVRLRMAAIAPDGTSWAREIRAASRDVFAESDGELELKWYLGGIAGDEVEAIERIRRGQLDGTAGASFCEQLAPSLRVVHVPGLIRNRVEGRYVIARLRRVVDEEFAKSGFVDLGMAPFGLEMLFSRKPISSMRDLRDNRVWVWTLAEPLHRILKQMGVHVVTLAVDEAGRAFDDNRVDVLVGVPTATLAYQWGSRVRYFTPLPVSLLPGCVLVTQKAFDQLSLKSQGALRTAMAKAAVRFDEVGNVMDEALLGRLLEKQGVRRIEVSESFRAQFLEEATHARDKDAVVPPALIRQVVEWLNELRAERGL